MKCVLYIEKCIVIQENIKNIHECILTNEKCKMIQYYSLGVILNKLALRTNVLYQKENNIHENIA